MRTTSQVSLHSRSARTAAARTRGRTALGVEPLENRTVPAVVVPAGVSVTEGATRLIGFKLNKAPTADVSFTVESSDAAEATIDKQSLTFTPANFRSPQFVTISAVEDFVQDGKKSVKIITGVSTSEDSRYANKAVRDVSVTVIDSKRVQPIDPALYQGDFSGSFSGALANGPITATVSDRVISVAITINAPRAGILNSPAYGTGTIGEDGSFSFQAQGTVFGAIYTGSMSIGENGQVIASGTWKYRNVASGTWRVAHVDTPPSTDPVV